MDMDNAAKLQFHELRSERLIIRQLQDADAHELYSAVAESRDNLRPWLPFADDHQSPEESLEYIRQSSEAIAAGVSFNLSIWSAAEYSLLGCCGLHIKNERIPSFEIGYWARKSAEGNGYITEAVHLLYDFMFTSWNARRIEIRCDSENARSAAVAVRSGFQFEGSLRSAHYVNGKISDMDVYSLLNTDPH